MKKLIRSATCVNIHTFFGTYNLHSLRETPTLS